MQGDLWVAVAEIGQTTDQPLLRQLGRYCNTQHRLRAGIAQFVTSFTNQFKRLLQTLQQPPRSGRGHNLPALAGEQRGAELFFQLTNLVADRAVGDAQLGRRPTKVGMTSGALESAQGVKRR